MEAVIVNELNTRVKNSMNGFPFPKIGMKSMNKKELLLITIG